MNQTDLNTKSDPQAIPQNAIRVTVNPLPLPPDMAQRLAEIVDMALDAYREHEAAQKLAREGGGK
jgi:hypothetical protein